MPVQGVGIMNSQIFFLGVPPRDIFVNELSLLKLVLDIHF